MPSSLDGLQGRVTRIDGPRRCEAGQRALAENVVTGEPGIPPDPRSPAPDDFYRWLIREVCCTSMI